ncbi:MAG: hypothetical protein NUK65_12880, partial [Firmicutes bacterium]|nr:hypothetical protein [Bacillota bacterium]
MMFLISVTPRVIMCSLEFYQSFTIVTMFIYRNALDLKTMSDTASFWQSVDAFSRLTLNLSFLLP